METGLIQGEGGLYLLPAKTKVIPFQLVPQPEDVGKLLQVRQTESSWKFIVNIPILNSYDTKLTKISPPKNLRLKNPSDRMQTS